MDNEKPVDSKMIDENQIVDKGETGGDNQITENAESKKKSHRLFLDDTEY